MKLQVYKKVDVAGVLRLEIPCPQFAGKDVTVTIERTKRKRSLSQNNYYWGCVVPYVKEGLKDAYGETLSDDKVHYEIVMYCNYKEAVNNKTGEVKRFPMDTHTLTTIEYEEFLMRVRKFAAEEFDINIPEPNEQSEINY